MIDANGLIIEHDTRLPRVLVTEADHCKLYGKPVAWDEFNDAEMRCVWISSISIRSLNVSRTDRNTKRASQLLAWPWTVVPYENVWDRTVDESDDLKCPCTFYSHMLHHLG